MMRSGMVEISVWHTSIQRLGIAWMRLKSFSGEYELDKKLNLYIAMYDVDAAHSSYEIRYQCGSGLEKCVVGRH